MVLVYFYSAENKHKRFETGSTVNGHLHYPADQDRSLNETAADKVLQYRTDYNNRPSHVIYFMSAIVSTSGHLHCEFVCLLFLQDHRETDHFLAASGVQLPQKHFHLSTTDYVEYRWVTYSF